MDNKNTIKAGLVAQISLLGEMIIEKTQLTNVLAENLKKYEGSTLGSKEVSERVNNHIKKQKVDILGLIEKKQVMPEVGKVLDIVLNSIQSSIKSACEEVDRLYFSKQGEFLYLKLELEKLANLKTQYEKKLQELESVEITQAKNEQLKKQEQPDVNSVDKKQRIRPDKNPNTKAGRAALDIAERKRKYKSKLS